MYVDVKEELIALERHTDHSTVKRQALRSQYGALLVHSYRRLVAAKRNALRASAHAAETEEDEQAVANVDLSAELELVKRIWNSFVRKSTPTPTHHTLLMQAYGMCLFLFGA